MSDMFVSDPAAASRQRVLKVAGPEYKAMLLAVYGALNDVAASAWAKTRPLIRVSGPEYTSNGAPAATDPDVWSGVAADLFAMGLYRVVDALKQSPGNVTRRFGGSPVDFLDLLGEFRGLLESRIRRVVVLSDELSSLWSRLDATLARAREITTTLNSINSTFVIDGFKDVAAAAAHAARLADLRRELERTQREIGQLYAEVANVHARGAAIEKEVAAALVGFGETLDKLRVDIAGMAGLYPASPDRVERMSPVITPGPTGPASPDRVERMPTPGTPGPSSGSGGIPKPSNPKNRTKPTAPGGIGVGGGDVPQSLLQDGAGSATTEVDS